MNAEVEAAPKMKVTAIAPWAGCKRNLAERLHAIFGPHYLYCAPFCGGLGEFMTKPVSRVEILNDLHGDITNLARVIADRKLGPMLYRRLRRVLFCQAIHEESQQALKTAADPLERAYLYFIKAWMSWGGVAGTKRGSCKMSIRYTPNGGQQAVRFFNAVRSIPAWRRRLANATILNMDGFKLLEKVDDAPGTLIYCDPPYIVNKVSYEHDFAPDDHARLAAVLRGFKQAKVVVSYYDHPSLAQLYPGWKIHRIEVIKAIAQIGKRESHRESATEVVLVNERPQEHADLSLFGE